MGTLRAYPNDKNGPIKEPFRESNSRLQVANPQQRRGCFSVLKIALVHYLVHYLGREIRHVARKSSRSNTSITKLTPLDRRGYRIRSHAKILLRVGY